MGWLSARDGRRIKLLALRPNEGLAEVTDLIEAGRILPAVDEVFPLSEVPAALERFGAGEQRGRIVIEIS